MFADLVGLVFAIKDIHHLLTQQQLGVIITFLETVAEVQVRTAIEELRVASVSTQPYEERNRAIGHLNVAATALVTSLEKRSLVLRLTGLDNSRRAQTYLQLTGYYLVIARLYLDQKNKEPARQYASKADRAFDGYAALVFVGTRDQVAGEFVCVVANDQAGQSFIYPHKYQELVDLKLRYGVGSNSEVFTLLAQERLDAQRDQLFGWLVPLGLGKLD